MPRIKFRPHHFLCTLGFEGKGYSPDFVAHFQKIAGQLAAPRTGDQVEIEVVEGLDSLCSQCPNQDGNICESQHKVGRMDRAHAEILGVRKGQVVSWGEAKQLLAERMTPQLFEAACSACAWKSMGACGGALQRLLQKRSG